MVVELIVTFLICIGATTIGAITGVGGGIIIKPVLDAFSSMTVAQISFLSGCTALSMAVVSMCKKKGGESMFDKEVAVKLAAGSVLGGFLGQWLFGVIKDSYNQDSVIGIVQNVVMIILLVGIILYMANKKKIKTHRVTSVVGCMLTGVVLGVFSSFLGIGGGPINLVALYFFFSMTTKVAAYNSIFVILCSQIASIVMSFSTNSIPELNYIFLVFMVIGGVLGGVIGKKIAKKISDEQVEFTFFGLLVVIAIISSYNIYNFATM